MDGFVEHEVIAPAECVAQHVLDPCVALPAEGMKRQIAGGVGIMGCLEGRLGHLQIRQASGVQAWEVGLRPHPEQRWQRQEGALGVDEGEP